MNPNAVLLDETLAVLVGFLILFVVSLRYVRPYTTYLVEDREFSHEGAARDYLASFHDDVPRRVIRRRRFQWRDAP